jgi:hypothetical protein
MLEKRDLHSLSPTNKTNEKKDIFTDKLLGAIKKDNLSPRPRWQFLLKNYIIYITGALALLIGAVAVSVIIYLVKFNDWGFYYHTKKTFLEFFFLTAPYFWILFLGLFIFIVYYNFKHTPKGYRYPSWALVLASIVLSIFLGIAFFALGLGEKIDDTLGRRAPFYSHIFNRQIDFWSQPDQGRLSGIIIGQGEEKTFILIDRELKEWSVSLSATSSLNGFDNNVFIKHPVRLIGRQTEDGSFMAERIFRASRPGQGFFKELEGRPRMNRMKIIMFENSPPVNPLAPFPVPRH